jgi:hypothetical protein
VGFGAGAYTGAALGVTGAGVVTGFGFGAGFGAGSGAGVGVVVGVGEVVVGGVVSVTRRAPAPTDAAPSEAPKTSKRRAATAAVNFVLRTIDSPQTSV